MHKISFRAPCLFALGVLVAGTLVTVGCSTSPGTAGAVYRADTPFPEFMPLWREGWKWTDENGQRVRYAYEGMPLGGYIHVYFENPADTPLEVNDVLLNGVSLAKGIAREPAEGAKKRRDPSKFASSLQFSKLPADQIDRLMAAGEPVWWKVDPPTIPPGGMAELTIRLRRDPDPRRLDVSIPAGDSELCAVVRTSDQPRVVGIGFSPGRDKVFLYLRHPKGGIAPSRIRIDGRDVTDNSTIGCDDAVDTVPVVIQLDSPVREPDFHCFEARYADGSRALAALRVWGQDFIYGMWGIPKEGNSPQERATLYLERLHRHNFNAIMSHYGGDVRKFAAGREGRDLARSLGIAIMDHVPGSYEDPLYYYLPDEPDAHDFACRNINPPGKRLGALAQSLVGKSKLFREKDPHTLHLVNVDNTYKPEQWYMYAQLGDVASADPYFPEQFRSVYRFDPMNLGAYTRPTYVYATGKIYQSACAPKPMHIILHTCRFDMAEYLFRAPTPEEKRVEVYYALAAGAKGISYWWYTPQGRYRGCGSRIPEMESLFTEIGLLGAELRTADPVLIRSCPADVPVKAPRALWVRSLLAGTDTLAVIVVNNNIASDRLGTVVVPTQNARVRLRLPSWLKPRDAFEITYGGTQDISWESAGPEISLDLGEVSLTRFVLISADEALRSQLQKRWQSQFASNVSELVARKNKLSAGKKNVEDSEK